MNLLLLSVFLLNAQLPTSPEPLASIALFNPIAWDGPSVVEIATGRIASPGSIDWSKVTLMRDGEEIPFSIREGRAHWKSALRAPVPTPVAEDLLVFSIAVPLNQWSRIDVVPGSPAQTSALVRENGRIEMA
ncbi:MAG: hypothetical protein RBU21_07640 [FCB group bacterium]|jgi:hypothetical protein|nr:hypothetical protein [FCB group bacterium]